MQQVERSRHLFVFVFALRYLILIKTYHATDSPFSSHVTETDCPKSSDQEGVVCLGHVTDSIPYPGTNRSNNLNFASVLGL